MNPSNLTQFLISNFSELQKHWMNTHSNGTLATTIILAASDGYQRAKVITFIIEPEDILEREGLKFVEAIKRKLVWCQKKFNKPLKWLRLEWVSTQNRTDWVGFNNELKKYKRNYFRSGIAYKGFTKPWCLLTEMELNANACLYGGSDISTAKVNRKNLEKYIISRHSSKNIPNYENDMEIVIFKTEGIFFDLDTFKVYELCTKPRHQGHRVVPPLDNDLTLYLIKNTTEYLAKQVLPTGKFEYGYFPCFGRTINFYNNLRHASSIYSLIEGYQFCRDNGQLSTQQSQHIATQIENALFYLENKVINHYGNDKAYVLETNNTIKLGANAVCILALNKYIQVFKDSTHNLRFLKLSQKLANGILAMQKENGQFVHVLDAETLEIVSENHVIYYDGEAVFGLMRLYGIDKNERWINCVEKAFDYFIESGSGHNGAHDHWLAYCTNEMILYRPQKKYFQFAVNNIKGFTNFIKNRITTYPTLLELSMAFHKTLLELDKYPEHHDVLNELDLQDFYEALHARANYLVNGFFFPEMAMYYKKPDTILHGCFIRHHAFRVRIDDVQHYISGWVAYYDLITSRKYPQTATQVNRNLVSGLDVLTPQGLAIATNGRWLIKPPKDWTATGLCIHPGSFKKGCLLVARSKSMQRGYLPKVAIKSFTIKGASGIITDSEEDFLDFSIPVLLVNNVRQATLEIGKWARKYYRGDVIGITGSAGKTTTVAMLAHTLQIEGEVGQTKGSANLPIGIAWNMASIPQSAKSWVLEMAIGNMVLNSQIVQPDIAIITNIAAAHLEFHKTLEIIAIKKSRIFESMKVGSLAIICRDIAQYDFIVNKAQSYGLNVVSYGEHDASDIRLVSYKFEGSIVNIKGVNYTIKLTSIGKHMILNAMAVLAVADYKHLNIDNIIHQLETFVAVEGRGEVFQTLFERKQVTVYDEAYNANPLSMRAALEAFSEVDAPVNKKVVILGDMLELGADSQKYHLDLADEIETSEFRVLIFVGELSSVIAEKLNKPTKVYHFLNTESLAKKLSQLIEDDDLILIKASNSIGLRKLFS